ncbi:hypothetical protein PSACC_02468 [Paramicrosporidium saccamoebae]|uniref:Alanyl-transfer RNA synthetases family profile domain-containing protein n=1 Tax=Paramicrosporidium saccamoebae TaxID=1246581 RepID=A0A2H9TIY2_9FUNG|nr:hypothetical protein PSACC_02468 [Paramicrosporidium saccamoebae]
MRTELVYQNDMNLFTLTAKIISYIVKEDSKAVMILDQTIFYPQGGGQPSDVGTIKSQSGLFKVKMAKMNPETGQVEHEGVIDQGIFAVDEEVSLDVDGAARLLHSRLHSAGHLLDHAIQSLSIPLKGTKGYHFPAGPYVEYIPTGDIDLTSTGLDLLKKNIETRSHEMIAEKRPITVVTSKLEDLETTVRETLPEKARNAEFVRLVHFEGAPIPGPCGGTHVTNTSEIGNFVIKKVSFKANALRIAYKCE